MRIRVLLLLGAVLGASVLMAGQSSAATTNVTVSGNSFVPSSVNIVVGDRVQWDIPAGHSVTADDLSFDRDGPDPTFARTFDAAGTFRYYCKFHGAAGGIGMSGTITVGSATATPTPTNTATPTPTPRSACGGSTIGAALLTSPASAAYGAVRLTLDSAGTTITGQWALNGLSSNVTGVNIRRLTGDTVVLSFTGISGTGGTFATTNGSAAELSAFNAVLFNPAGYYVNVETTSNAGGEIRGTLACAPDVAASTVQASFSGVAQVPTVTSSASGIVSLRLGATGNVVDGDWYVTGLGSFPTAAHIHVGAAGANGPPIVDFNNPVPPGGGRFSTHTTGVATSVIRAVQYAPYGFYVNVHTSNNPNGEVRGQLGALRHFLGTVPRNQSVSVQLADGRK